MPDLDFIGFQESQVDKLINEIEPILQSLPFMEEIVFIRHNNQSSKVLQLKGGEAPFLRIYTRSSERASILTERLKQFCDIEIIYIAMFTKKVKNNV